MNAREKLQQLSQNKIDEYNAHKALLIKQRCDEIVQECADAIENSLFIDVWAYTVDGMKDSHDNSLLIEMLEQEPYNLNVTCSGTNRFTIGWRK